METLNMPGVVLPFRRLPPSAPPVVDGDRVARIRDGDDRVAKIRTSLEKIDALMCELKKVSSPVGGAGPGS